MINIRITIRSALIVLFFLGVSDAYAQNDGTLIVKVHGFRNNKGKALIGLYDSPDGFPIKFKKAMHYTIEGIKNKSVTVTFKTIAKGSYAVCVVHDEDGQGDVDRYWYGRPKEGSGVSNNPQKMPAFKDALFSVSEHLKEITINIQYP